MVAAVVVVVVAVAVVVVVIVAARVIVEYSGVVANNILYFPITLLPLPPTGPIMPQGGGNARNGHLHMLAAYGVFIEYGAY